MPRKKHGEFRKKLAKLMHEKMERKKKEKRQQVHDVSPAGPSSAGSEATPGPSTSSVCLFAGSEQTPVGTSSLCLFESKYDDDDEELDWRYNDDDFKLYSSDEEEEEIEVNEYVDTPNDVNEEYISKMSSVEMRKLLVREIAEEGEDVVEEMAATKSDPITMVRESFLCEMANLSKCVEDGCEGKGELVTKKNCFDCDIEVKCGQCGFILLSKKAEKHKIHGFPRSVATNNNSAIVYNSMLDGTGRAGVNNLCGILGLDGMPVRNYERHKTYIQSVTKSKYKSSLRSHSLIHKGIKPHSCSICEKSFTRKSSLTTHSLIHKSSKAQSCMIDDKKKTEETDSVDSDMVIEEHNVEDSFLSKKERDRDNIVWIKEEHDIDDLDVVKEEHDMDSYDIVMEEHVIDYF